MYAIFTIKSTFHSNFKLVAYSKVVFVGIIHNSIKLLVYIIGTVFLFKNWQFNITGVGAKEICNKNYSFAYNQKQWRLIIQFIKKWGSFS